MRMIAKVQRPVSTNGDEPLWLIYAKGRTRIQHVFERDIPASVKAAMADGYKAYFDGTWSPSGGWSLDARVEAQDW